MVDAHQTGSRRDRRLSPRPRPRRPAARRGLWQRRRRQEHVDRAYVVRIASYFEDQPAALKGESARGGTQDDALDLALLVDGLSAEREQGITIDIAHRFFATGQRRFIVADAPGHEQYTKDLVTAASKALHTLGKHTYLLDGDNVRKALNRDPGFTDAGRVENIRRVTEVAKLMVDAGLIILVAFISPFRIERGMARTIVDDSEFIEVFVGAPLAVAEQRDLKCLYRQARRAGNFTDIVRYASRQRISTYTSMPLATTQTRQPIWLSIVFRWRVALSAFDNSSRRDYLVGLCSADRVSLTAACLGGDLSAVGSLISEEHAVHAVPYLTVPTPDMIRPGSPTSLAMALAAHPEPWRPLVDYRTDTRWYRLLDRNPHHEVWLMSWLPGQGADLHDHGSASGTFAVAAGTLTERVVAANPGRPLVEVTRSLETGRCRVFGSHYVHQVTNTGTVPAVSVHVYSPGLTVVNRYRVEPPGLDIV